MKQEHKHMTWFVKNFDCNKQVIEDYDVLKYREDQIKKLKKKCATKEEFAEKLRRELMSQYWARTEYELIIELTEDGRVLLKPWVGCRDDEQATIDVTDDTTFDWKGFAVEHIGKQIFKNEAKVDVFSQLDYVWDDLISYCWNYHHKYQRRKKND